MDPQNTKVWFAYFLGFSLTLAFKWTKAVYLGREQGKTVKQVTLEWLFEPSVDNGSSWVATIGGVWVIGSLYVNQLVDVAGIRSIPVNNSIAFFMGSLFEVLVPNLIKWIVSQDAHFRQ